MFAPSGRVIGLQQRMGAVACPLTFAKNRHTLMKAKLDSGPCSAESVDISGSSFDDVNLSSSSFHNVSLKGAKFEDVAFTGATIQIVCLGGVSIEDASYGDMRIEGILVTELLQCYRASDGGLSRDQQENA